MLESLAKAGGSSPGAKLDGVVAALCIAGIATVAFALTGASRLPVRDDARMIATVDFASAPLRRRAVATLVWDPLDVGDPAYDRDTVFVPPGAHAIIRFNDGATVQLEPDSLAVIEAPEHADDSLEVNLLRGFARGATQNTELSVRLGASEARIAPGSKAILKMTRDAVAEVRSTSGQTSVVSSETSVQVAAGEIGRVDDAGAIARGTVHTLAATLSAPADNQRLYAPGQVVDIEFRWVGSAVAIQLAADREFSTVMRSAGVRGTTHLLNAVRDGAWYWRLVDEEGQAASETRLVFVRATRPPQLLIPRPGEIVTATPGDAIDFRWRRVFGARRYRLQVAATASFENSALDRVVEGDGYNFAHELVEGTYFWRARSEVDGEGSAFAPTVRFRLVTRELPRAPEMLDAEVEVEAQ